MIPPPKKKQNKTERPTNIEKLAFQLLILISFF